MTDGVGRFGPIKNLDTIILQEPLSKLVNCNMANLRVSHYYFDEPIFDEYELTTVRATWDFRASETVVRDGYNVLDLGCGDGRLLLHLAENFNLGHSVGLDISEVAIQRLEQNISFKNHRHIEPRCADIFRIPNDIASRKFDLITFGDATINFILEEEKLADLFSSARKQLRGTDSRMMVSVFGDGTPEKLSFMDKRVTVVPFRRNNGQATLIWWAYRCDPNKLIMHRSVFAQTGWNESGDIEGVVSDLRDRMWTPSTIIPIATQCGLAPVETILSEVQDGAALGMDTAVTFFKAV